MSVILQINTVVNTGSTGKIAEAIGNYLIKKGDTSYIAFSRGPGISSSKTIRIGSKYDMIIHGLFSRLLDLHGFASKRATKRLVKQIEAIKPDLIHLHNIHGYYLNIPILFNYLSEKKIPVVWTFHDFWPCTGHCAYFSSENCYKWLNGCYNCQQLGRYPKSFIVDNSRKNWAKKKHYFQKLEKLHCVVVSQWMAGILYDSFFKKYPITVITNGIDRNIFYPRRSFLSIISTHQLQNKVMLLGVATVWTRHKGFYDYIRLSTLLDDQYIIVLIGVSKEQKKMLPSNILGIERTENQEELAEFYSLANITLNLSYEESFGLTTVESFACGTPVITYDTTANPELITTDTGVLVKAGDIDELKSAIKYMSDKKVRYSPFCEKRCKDRYDKTDMISKYYELYQSMLS